MELDRRTFLKATGVACASAAVATNTTACAPVAGAALLKQLGQGMIAGLGFVIVERAVESAPDLVSAAYDELTSWGGSEPSQDVSGHDEGAWQGHVTAISAGTFASDGEVLRSGVAIIDARGSLRVMPSIALLGLAKIAEMLSSVDRVPGEVASLLAILDVDQRLPQDDGFDLRRRAAFVISVGNDKIVRVDWHPNTSETADSDLIVVYGPRWKAGSAYQADAEQEYSLSYQEAFGG